MSEPRPLIRRATWVALARAANAIFFLLTSTYCLLTYSSFAYQQFVRPHLVSWLAGFAAWHHFGFWLMLMVTAWTLVDVARPFKGREPVGRNEVSRARHIAWAYLAVSVAIGVVLLVRPVLPQVENNGAGLALAIAALAPPVWLALVDHYRWRAAITLTPTPESRVMRGALLAGAIVWAAQMVAVPWRFDLTGEIRLTSTAVWFGVLTSAAAHFLVFAVLSAAALAVVRASRPAGVYAEYWTSLALATLAAALVINRQMFAAIAFRGWPAWVLSFELAAMLVAVWSGVAHLLAGATPSAVSVVDMWLRPVPGARSRRVAICALFCLALVEAGLIAYVMTFDWAFVLQKLSVLAIWFLAFAYSYAALAPRERAFQWRSLAAPALAAAGAFVAVSLGAPRAAAWLADAEFVPEFALEGYVAVDPSYRVIHDALHVEARGDAAFYSHLRANSLIQHVQVAPVPIDFEQPLRAVAAPKPNIFVFVIDSLRPDYLSPYNAAVGFTPNVGAFAKDSVVFERAFTRYGGTGLSVPAIWAGGMLLHKQYVTPFDPMNALLKMLDADGYRRVMGMDSVVIQLMAPPRPEDELDRDVHIMSYRLCTTLDDLSGKLRAGAGDRRPVFAYSLPQDLHISHIRSRPLPPGASYPGFFPQVAAQVEEMDGCFGRFIAFLKTHGLYEDSVIVVTSDHGDSLGEGVRFGHSYTMFPEVVRIPLIVRLPERFRQTLKFDAGAVSLSTDLTPTFYALAGHAPADLGPLYGRPLFVRHGGELAVRRQQPQLLASSYGPVYAVLRDNGTRLYIADGVNSRDYLYQLADHVTTRLGITAGEREEDRRFITRQVDDLARAYGFVP